MNAKFAVKLVSIAGIIFTVIYIAYLWQQGILTSQDKMSAYITGFGAAAALIFVIIQIIQVVVPIIPGGVSCIFGVAAFGNLMGFVYNYVGICIGSIIVFLLTKKYGRPLMVKIFDQKKIDKYEKWTGENNRFTKFFAAAIVFPVAPDDFLCYLAGTTPMSNSTFVKIILLGKPLSIAIYSMGLNVIIQHALSTIA